MALIDGLVLALATQRLMSLWFEELCRVPREWLARRAGRLAYLAGCQLCISVWAAGVVAGLWMLPFGRMPVAVLALSGAALFLDALARAALAPGRIATEVAKLTQAVQAVSVVE